jgi:hypothetical protein
VWWLRAIVAGRRGITEMRKVMPNKPTVWMQFECGGGARWTSTSEDCDGQTCNFSGCNCGTVVKKVGVTSDRTEAADWFRRPVKNEGV